LFLEAVPHLTRISRIFILFVNRIILVLQDRLVLSHANPCLVDNPKNTFQ